MRKLKERLKEIWIQLTLNITGIHESWVIINERKEYLIDVEHKGEILTSDEGIFSPIKQLKNHSLYEPNRSERILDRYREHYWRIIEKPDQKSGFF